MTRPPLLRRHPSRPLVATLPTLFTFVVWFAVALSALYWGLKMQGKSSAPASVVVSNVRPQTPAPKVGLDALLGGDDTAAADPTESERLKRASLVGIIADTRGHGLALISVDGKPAKPYRVGSNVTEDLVLTALEPGRAIFGENHLELPKLALAANNGRPAANANLTGPGNNTAVMVDPAQQSGIVPGQNGISSEVPIPPGINGPQHMGGAGQQQGAGLQQPPEIVQQPMPAKTAPATQNPNVVTEDTPTTANALFEQQQLTNSRAP